MNGVNSMNNEQLTNCRFVREEHISNGDWLSLARITYLDQRGIPRWVHKTWLLLLLHLLLWFAFMYVCVLLCTCWLIVHMFVSEVLCSRSDHVCAVWMKLKRTLIVYCLWLWFVPIYIYTSSFYDLLFVPLYLLRQFLYPMDCYPVYGFYWNAN
jgi:hypothetical protein